MNHLQKYLIVSPAKCLYMHSLSCTFKTSLTITISILLLQFPLCWVLKPKWVPPMNSWSFLCCCCFHYTVWIRICWMIFDTFGIKYIRSCIDFFWSHQCWFCEVICPHMSLSTVQLSSPTLQYCIFVLYTFLVVELFYIYSFHFTLIFSGSIKRLPMWSVLITLHLLPVELSLTHHAVSNLKGRFTQAIFAAIFLLLVHAIEWIDLRMY